MYSSREIRQRFLDFFQNKAHQIVASAPIVVKNDPTLMFTNAGMNQFKDYFLGNKKAPNKRVADTQKCLRVSGKHNDLEEVGVDHYHHTMFEMLGNWSFGDYFKQEAIAWSWELLTEVYGIEKDRLYVTVFEGDTKEGLAFDQEAYDIWAKLCDPARILKGNKKDNFWEMGDTGPCGPCSEIHVDMRSDAERQEIGGDQLVNKDHPEVIEIWNNVFMEFNRKANGSLEKLPAQHVDTGMGFERLVRVLQKKQSNYDTDVFQPIIKALESISGQQYKGTDQKQDIAFRVIADHIRAVAFCIADGQLPSNNGAGYVIRRILRRALRYGYSYLNMREPFMYKLIPTLCQEMGAVFPELEQQKDFIAKVIQEEGNTFMKTLANGLDKIQTYLQANPTMVDGKTAFELYDTFGFPIDLTLLIASEHQANVDIDAFETLLKEQKERSRKDAQKETGDWNYVLEEDNEEFIGYDFTESELKIVRMREVKVKDKAQYQMVFNITPFYGESGGQVGDTGQLIGLVDNEVIKVIDTQKENDLIVHVVDKLPKNTQQTYLAKVDLNQRIDTACNHSATHLLHAALKQVLGSHVAQKGSLVNAEELRFDFSHFAKLSDEELQSIEQIVNDKIQAHIPLNEQRLVPIQKAVEELGATALFGEKYGDVVRVITFDQNYSVELCGGTHIDNTGKIRHFKIISESSVAAGVRRIEAITGKAVIEHFKTMEDLMHHIQVEMGQPKDLLASIQKLQAEKAELNKKLEQFEEAKALQIKQTLIQSINNGQYYKLLFASIKDLSLEHIKTIAFQLKAEQAPLLGIIAANIDNKPNIIAFASDALINEHQINCSQIVRDLSKHIQGGGGGQAFYANAGGKLLEGLEAALKQAREQFI